MNNCVTVTRNMFRYRLMVLAYFLWVTMGVCAQAPEQKPGLPELEQMLNSKLGRLDSDEEGKGRLIKDIATEILNVPSNVNRLKLAKKLADLSTNSNADRASVQLAANLLAQTLVEQGDSPAEEKKSAPPTGVSRS